jgi:hypothetical protein
MRAATQVLAGTRGIAGCRWTTKRTEVSTMDKKDVSRVYHCQGAAKKGGKLPDFVGRLAIE